ncbi:MAG: hypothetical protein GY720_10300 [bacterium]|nr:hypothetical protein [bacterium]
MRLVVLGDPIEHSLSPTLHTAAFAATGLIGNYGRRRVDVAGLRAAVAEVRAGVLDGANVTMPHKESAAPLCDRLAATAGRVQAVNTLVRVNREVVGHNTDVAGIRAAWEAQSLPSEAPVLILGAGGAAAAALVALEGRTLFISSRRPAAAAELGERVAVEASPHPWGSGVPDAVVVNATPMGMGGEHLGGALLEDAIGLFDMAYGTESTPAVSWMIDQGRPVADGRQMLLHQAAAAFELWTGYRAPIDAMAASLENPVVAG